MDKYQVQDYIKELLEEQTVPQDLRAQANNAYSEIKSVKTYEDDGVLTTDAGLVVKIGDRKYQLTIVEV